MHAFYREKSNIDLQCNLIKPVDRAKSAEIHKATNRPV